MIGTKKTISHSTTSYTACVAFALMAMTGCAFMKKKTAASKAEVRQAETDGDWAMIRDVCEKRRKARYKVQPMACRKLKRHEAISKVESASCSEIKKVWKKGFRERRGAFERPDKYARLNFVRAAAKRVAQCKHWAFLFERVAMDRGRFGGHGKAGLYAVAKAGLPILEGWKRYMATHQGKKFFQMKWAGKDAVKAALVTSEWLERGKHFQFCKPLVAATLRAHRQRVYAFRDYFSKARCKGAIPMMLEMMSASLWRIRQQVCYVFHGIYDRSILARVKDVAKNDPYSYVKTTKWRDGTVTKKTIYPVRKACSGIEKKILRASK